MKDVLKKTTESQPLYDLSHLTSYNEKNKRSQRFLWNTVRHYGMLQH